MVKKDTKKDKEPKKEKAPTMNEKLDQVLTGINTLAGAVNKLVELQTPTPLSKVIPLEDDKGKTDENFTPKLEDESYPEEYLPPKFRQIVDDVLSEEFGIKVVDFPDRTDMQINIIVPEKYSSVSKEDRAKGMEDIRSRIMPRAMGENGVKEWCKIIRVNLNKYYSKEGIQSPFSEALSIN